MHLALANRSCKLHAGSAIRPPTLIPPRPHFRVVTTMQTPLHTHTRPRRRHKTIKPNTTTRTATPRPTNQDPAPPVRPPARATTSLGAGDVRASDGAPAE